MEHCESITKNSSLRTVVLRSCKHFNINICTLCISAVITCVPFKVQDHFSCWGWYGHTETCIILHRLRCRIVGTRLQLTSTCVTAVVAVSDVRWTKVRWILGCSYCASSVHIAIRLPTDATVYFVYLFPLFLPYMFRALISPSSGVSQAVFLYTTIWFMRCLCCSSACACGLVCCGGRVQWNHHDKPVHRHTLMSNINTAWTKWLYIKTAWDTPDDGLMRARNM